MKKYTLNDGHHMLAIGSGTNTFGKENRSYMGEINFDTTEIEEAIKAGYRRFDTAISYRNEAVLALGIKRSQMKRSELFITSKLPGRPEYIRDRKSVEAGIASSLKSLETDYIDLYLIHHPWDNLDEMLQVWRVFEEYHDKGILKSIGVSNFNEEQLQFFVENARIKPAVNQIESNPSLWNDALIEFTKNLNVLPEVWGPFHGMTDAQKETLSTIGEKHGKSWAQVLLRYQLDRDVAMIPKSHHTERQALNLQVFDFSLTQEDRIAIRNLK